MTDIEKLGEKEFIVDFEDILVRFGKQEDAARYERSGLKTTIQPKNVQRQADDFVSIAEGLWMENNLLWERFKRRWAHKCWSYSKKLKANLEAEIEEWKESARGTHG